MNEFEFVLGSHEPAWLARTRVPLMLSRNRFVRRKSMPARALGPWDADSAAFTMLLINGKWTLTPRAWVAEVRLYSREIGNLRRATIQDWMCEPFMLKKTGLSVKRHQELTVRSFLELRDLAPEIAWLPVLQGWEPHDYLRHREMYAAHGVDLEKLERVGVGSVCRRGHTEEIRLIAEMLSDLQIHGFGVKTRGIEVASKYFRSADSMAWSFRARHRAPLKGCTHRTCANCMKFALWWREQLLSKLEGTRCAA